MFAKGEKRPIKYVHPGDFSLGWTGYGQRPKWVSDFLSAGGSLDELATVAASSEALSIKRGSVAASDQSQLPGLPPVPKKRGRPSTGNAKSPAVRQSESRHRKAMKLIENPSGASLSTLLECYSRFTGMAQDNPGEWADLLIAIADELSIRARRLKQEAGGV